MQDMLGDGGGQDGLDKTQIKTIDGEQIITHTYIYTYTVYITYLYYIYGRQWKTINEKEIWKEKRKNGKGEDSIKGRKLKEEEGKDERRRKQYKKG